jgi:hypothetical protein
MCGPHSRKCIKCTTGYEEKDNTPHGYSFINRMHKLHLLHSTHWEGKRFPDSNPRNRVAKRKKVLITRRGKPAALIGPPPRATP